MKKRILTVIISALFVGVIALAILHDVNILFAKQLVRAIKENDIQTVEQTLAVNPHCINIYPQTANEIMFNKIGEVRGMNYPLVEACRTDNVEIVKTLLEKGADANCSAGFTPLSITYLCKEKHWYQISQLLIEYGASLDYVTEISGNKSSVLMDIVRVKAGANHQDYIPENEEVAAAFYYAIEHCDHSKIDWMWVLQESITGNRVEIVKFLLDENYCNVNDTTPSKMTALMFAARDSTVEMTQLLLDRGADKDMIDSDGKTAYDYAVEHGKDDIAALLANPTVK